MYVLRLKGDAYMTLLSAQLACCHTTMFKSLGFSALHMNLPMYDSDSQQVSWALMGDVGSYQLTQAQMWESADFAKWPNVRGY